MTRQSAPNSSGPIPTEAPAKGSSGVPADLLTDMAAGRTTPDSSTPIDLDTLLDQDITAWRPEVGDKLIGRVLNVEVAGQDSTFGAYPLLTVRRDGDGQLVNLHAFHGVIRKELARKGVGEGDRIGVKYLGTAEGGDFGEYENYRVVVERQSRATVAEIEAGR